MCRAAVMVDALLAKEGVWLRVITVRTNLPLI
jgi:hypothetical protein